RAAAGLPPPSPLDDRRAMVRWERMAQREQETRTWGFVAWSLAVCAGDRAKPVMDAYIYGNYPGRLRSPVQSALLHFGRREKRVPLKGIPDGLKDIFGMLTSGGKIPANATELLGTLQRAKPA